VQPEHKVRIVSAWQNSGFVTAMTGDGVNDAPSIKTADIGIGMGITGTDVTKNVADMVLADDNFATIVGAVHEGRRIYDNIRRVILFLFSSNISEVISVFTASLMGFTILQPVHILWINLITDSFPALALGTEQAENGIMNRPPRNPKEGVFARGLGVMALIQGIVISLLVMVSYFIGLYLENGSFVISDSLNATTMAFLTMSLAEVFHSYNVRSQRTSIFRMGYQNKLLNISAIAGILLSLCVVTLPPLQKIFGFSQLSLLNYAISLLLAVLIIPIIEIVKLIRRHK
jgi:Ca2+-transporting ATPase